MVAEREKALPVCSETLEYALRIGHYEVVDGFHVSHAYLCSLVFKDRAILSRAAVNLLEMFALPSGSPVDAIVTGTPCGTVMADFAAAHLGQLGHHNGQLVPLSSETVPLVPISLPAQARCMVLFEHALTGKRIREVVRWILEQKGQIVGIGVLCDRRAKQGPIEGIEVKSLVDMASVGVNADLAAGPCPLCKDNVPLISNLRVV